MNIEEILKKAYDVGASDVFLVVRLTVSYRQHGAIKHQGDTALTPDITEDLIKQIYTLARRDMTHLEETGDDDFSFAIRDLSRFRVNAFKQRGSLAAVIRIITFTLPDPHTLGIPDSIIQLDHFTKGLVLVTGPAGNGKSTTLACMIDHINHNYERHIITLEDPLEFLHSHDKSIVTQREINLDTESYVTALRAALRQSPDVILLGEMRDYETTNVAMTAAETGHLIISSLHTIGAANTIDRIIDVFPPNQQHQIAIQLSMVLQAIVSQQLVPTIDGSMAPVFEVMTITPAIRNMIRDNKTPQIDGIVYSSVLPTMFSMDTSLLNLYKAGRITRETALQYASNPDMLSKKL